MNNKPVIIIDSGVNLNSNNIIKYNTVPYEPNIDYLNHGTTIARIILAINPNAQLVSIKVTNQGGTTVSDKLNQALVIASSYSPCIINISLGLPSYNQTTQDWINSLHSNNTKIITAAGNNSPYYPALYNNTLVVGSLNDDNTIASYSRHTQCDYYTYGSITIDNITYTGTSYSAAIISGIISKLL